MKSNKINVTVRIDKETWELAKILLPCSRNRFIEQQLRNYINSVDEISQLEQEIEEQKQEIQTKSLKLQHLKEIREANNKNKDKINKAMETVFNIVREHGEISENQINFISGANYISKEILTSEIKKHKFRITKYTKEEKETNLKNITI